MDTKKLRQKILDLAIHGKLVPQDPNDEPASVLLERIRAEKERLIAEGKIKRSKKSATSDTPHYENVPFEVPEGWCWCTVEDVFELNPKNKVEDNVICGFIPMALVDDGFGYSHSFEERPWGEVKKGYCHFQNGDIGIAKISPCFENRKSTIFSGLPNGIGAGTTELSILRGSLVDCRYFLFLFQSEWYLREGTKYFKGVVGQQRVNKEIFTTLQIPLPPLAEQQRIANAIETCMFLCSEIDEYRDGVHSAIVASKAKILDLAIHGKLVPQDANDEPASELLKRINPKAVSSCDNPHYEQVPFEIPGKWAWIRIDEINKFKSKTVNPLSYPTSQFELYSVPTFETGEPEFPYGKDVASSKVEVEEGDVLLCKINPHLNRVWVVRRRMAQLKSLASSEWIVIRTDEIMPEYLALTMQSPYFRELMMSNVSGVGGSLMRAQPTFVKQYMIPIPPIREQERIIEKVAQFNLYIDTIASTLP